VTDHRMFARSFDSLRDIFAFTSGFFGRERLDPRLLPIVDFALEELFTNMVKYSTMSDAAVRIDLTGLGNGVEVTLTDYDVEPFDVSRAPEVNVELPIEQRRPGGLGLHLIRKLVDSIEYEYSEESRQSRTTFRKTGTAPPELGDTPKGDGTNARD
jgi:anti-sigma regulatory factor (Ser/Thr protein kinase)